jgi:hypothetical protein
VKYGILSLSYAISSRRVAALVFLLASLAASRCFLAASLAASASESSYKKE